MGGSFKPGSSQDQQALAEALRRASGLVRSSASGASEMLLPDADLISQRDLARKAEALLASRRARDRLFGGAGLFGEPAWDIMLDLYAAEASGRKVSMSSAVIASHAPPTTGLRWIEKLIQMGFLEREADHLDRRRSFLRLSERAMELVRLAVIAS